MEYWKFLKYMYLKVSPNLTTLLGFSSAFDDIANFDCIFHVYMHFINFY